MVGDPTKTSQGQATTGPRNGYNSYDPMDELFKPSFDDRLIPSVQQIAPARLIDRAGDNGFFNPPFSE